MSHNELDLPKFPDPESRNGTLGTGMELANARRMPEREFAAGRARPKCRSEAVSRCYAKVMAY